MIHNKNVADMDALLTNLKQQSDKAGMRLLNYTIAASPLPPPRVRLDKVEAQIANRLIKAGLLIEEARALLKEVKKPTATVIALSDRKTA